MLSVSWSLLFLITGVAGISVYKISGKKHQAFMKCVRHASIWNNGEAEGWIIGKFYIGYVHKIQGQHEDIKELILICHNTYYTRNILKSEAVETSNDNVLAKKKFFTFYEREGNSYYRLFYSDRQLECITLTPRPCQQAIVEKIYEHYNTNTNTTVLLYGNPGLGKSTIALFLVNFMLTHSYVKISLVDTFNPSEAGDTFHALYTTVAPTQDSPLIVVIEEIDVMLWSIHSNTVRQHLDIPTQMNNKSDWNRFFDRLNSGFYKHVILIMTTNKDASYFDQLDKSYMRSNEGTGRVNLKYRV